MTYANGNSFGLGNGNSINVSHTLAAGQYPEPFWIRFLGPVQPGAI